MDRKSAQEVLNDCFEELTSHIADDLRIKNEKYQMLNQRIDDLIIQYPIIMKLESMNKDVSLTKEEIQAMIGLYELSQSKIAMEEEEIYYQGVKDCFEIMIQLSLFDIIKKM